jgi:hypothetical protein
MALARIRRHQRPGTSAPALKVDSTTPSGAPRVGRGSGAVAATSPTGALRICPALCSMRSATRRRRSTPGSARTRRRSTRSSASPAPRPTTTARSASASTAEPDPAAGITPTTTRLGPGDPWLARIAPGQRSFAAPSDTGHNPDRPASTPCPGSGHECTTTLDALTPPSAAAPRSPDSPHDPQQRPESAQLARTPPQSR